jgi:hypothetical protein
VCEIKENLNKIVTFAGGLGVETGNSLLKSFIHGLSFVCEIKENLNKI